MKKPLAPNLKRSARRKAPAALLPQKRSENLIVDEGLPEEVLVYDLDRHQAHCLNLSAALVWKNCDGQSTASEIAARVSRQLKQEFPEDAVWLALKQLDKLYLLVDSAPLPPKFAGMTRRQVIRGLGLAAVVAIPVVTSIVAPTAYAAATCVANGQPCPTGGLQCCGFCDTLNGNVCAGG